MVGATVAFASDGQRMTASHGVTSRGRPAPVGERTPFRIGSVGKLYTACVLLEQLAARGIPVETRVGELLPGFALAGGGEQSVTVAHLLSHTAGIEGDLWSKGHGDGADAIERYVADLRQLGTLFPAGAAWGYSNSGFVVAGALVERLSGSRFATPMAAFSRRLDLMHTELTPTRPPDGATDGHYGQREGEPREAAPDAARDLGAMAPAGSMAYGTAADLVKFALCQITPGAIDERVTAAMMKPVIELPRYGGSEPTHHGLGWKVYRWESETILGHNGGSLGHAAFLRLIPAQRCALALVGNTVPATGIAWARLSDWVWKQLGVAPPPPLAATGPVPAEAMARYTGTYEMRDVKLTLGEREGRLRLEVVAFGEPPITSWLSRVDENRLITSSGDVLVFESCGGADLVHKGPYTARRTA